jgi:hypothetical protein
VLGKDGEDHLERPCGNEQALLKAEEERNIPRTIKRRKANRIGRNLRRNCLLKHVIEGKKEVMRRRKRSYKQLLDDLKEKR